MTGVDRIGCVVVGGVVARHRGRTAPLFTVRSISDRWIHLQPVDGDELRTVSVPVAAWRSLTPVPEDDPRRFLCGL